jgi:RNA-directed DNA polymerase
MKRTGNLFPSICALENLMLADHKARKGKSDQYGVKKYDRDRPNSLRTLQCQLLDRTFRTSTYQVRTIMEKKERVIYKLPYFPDRIVHHGIMNILEPVFTAMFVADTYANIKGRGTHAASYAIRKVLRDEVNTQYYLQLDIRKFYPSINHDILKAQLRCKFKDPDLLWLLGEIIDSAPGLPIGNYLSQYLSNFYLSEFDHWLKQTKGVRHYFRYCDDLVILSGDKKKLAALAGEIQSYLQDQLSLQVKQNWKICPVHTGLDFVGYKHFHTHVLLRKSIKQSFARAIARGASRQTIASYNGWLKHCNGINLKRKLFIKAA